MHPAHPPDSPNDLVPLPREQQAVLNALLDGLDPNTLARKLARGDQRKAKRYRQLFRRWMQDPRFAGALAVGARVDLQLAAPSLGAALVKRAQRGRVDAIKLGWEVSGFHNPRVKHEHEHSGEITINLKAINRPQPVLDEAPVVDATVVE